MKLDFDPGFDITPLSVDEGFRLGADCFDKGTEFRKLDSVRKSLRDPNCDGPENVYAIMMDVGRKTDLPAMQQRMLLYGVVTYAAGQLGDEPIRSQGHIHKVSAHCGWSTPEVYEIWTGKAVIYMQESGQDDPGRCFAVEAGAGDVVIVPPGWVHATISADPKQPLTFGAWCDRDYGFAYADVRRHGGIAWFPLLTAEGKLRWTPNPPVRGIPGSVPVCVRPGARGEYLEELHPVREKGQKYAVSERLPVGNSNVLLSD